MLPARIGPLGDRLSTFSADGTVLPGVDALLAPGHTPGSTVFVISEGERRVLLIGDVVHCPVELVEEEWAAFGDVDPVLAARTRERVSRELDGAEVGGAHFPGLALGRLITTSVPRALDGAVTESPVVARAIADATRLHPERASLVLDDDVLTHGDVDRMSALVARGLAGAGLGRGNRVAVLGPNHLLTMVATLGIIRSGATWIPLNPADSIDAIAAAVPAVPHRHADLPLRLRRRARPDPRRGDDDRRDRSPSTTNQAAPSPSLLEWAVRPRRGGRAHRTGRPTI